MLESRQKHTKSIAMTHILISYVENPNFSPEKTRLNQLCPTLKGKNWIGFDKQGRETPFTNSINAEYLLIQNCSEEEFNTAITDEKILYRIVVETQLQHIPITPSVELLKVEIEAALSQNAFTKLSDPLWLFLQNQHMLTKTAKSLLPYIVINYLATNYLESFLQKAADSINSENQGEQLTTSCINTAYSLALLFYGEKIAQKCLNLVNQGNSVDLSVTLPSGVKWRYTIRGLFGGIFAREMARDIHFDAENPYKNINAGSQEWLNPFNKYIQPVINKCLSLGSDEKSIAALEEAFRNIDFDFNEGIIDSLQKEIDANRKKLSQCQSFVYFILITAPGKKMEHALVIEQNNSSGSDGYFIYQSSILEANLCQDIAKRDYGDRGERPLTYPGIFEFLYDMKILYSPYRNDFNMTSEQCFGYSRPADDLPVVSFKKNILTGPSVRYFSKAVNPADCLKNFYGFFNGKNTIFRSEQEPSSFNLLNNCLL